MKRPTDEQLHSVMLRIETWKQTDSSRDAGPAHYHFNDGVRAAIGWVLGEECEPIMRMEGFSTKPRLQGD